MSELKDALVSAREEHEASRALAESRMEALALAFEEEVAGDGKVRG